MGENEAFDNRQSNLAGCFFLPGLVVMNRDQTEASLCLGFRTWAAQSVPLDVHKHPNNQAGS